MQFMALVTMALCGMGLGMLFDVYRVLANTYVPSKWLYSLLDICFWMTATVAVFWVLFWSNYGEVRIFVFIGIIIGVWTYFVWFSSTMIRLTRYVIHVVQGLIRWIIRVIQLLIIKPLILLYRSFILFLGFLLTATIFLYKVMLQLVYPVWNGFKFLTRPLRARIAWPMFVVKGTRRLKSWWFRFFR